MIESITNSYIIAQSGNPILKLDILNKVNEIIQYLNDKESKKKPPLGIKPKFLIYEERVIEIINAINLRVQAGLTIPSEWIYEYNVLIDKFLNERN